MVSKYKYLGFANLKNLLSWSPIQISKFQMQDFKFELIKNGEIIKRTKKAIVIQDDVLYKRITIKMNSEGVQVRDFVKGSEIRTKNQFLISKGQLAISKIDARNGAFGIVPDDADGAVITGNFWVFDVNQEIADINYLVMLLSSKYFVNIWLECSNGGGNRLYLQEKEFMNYKIPLPDLATQQNIVAKYNGTIAKAAQAENKAVVLEKSIDKVLFEHLGIEDSKQDLQLNSKYKILKSCKLSKINRWDVWNRHERYFSSKYDFQTFETVVKGKPLYGANEKAVKKTTDVRYIRITDINEDGNLNSDKVSAQKVEEKYLLTENDFLIARSGNTVGKTFLYKDNMGKAIFAGYLVRYILNDKKIFPEYILYYTKSAIFKEWLLSNQRVFGQPNINGQEYLKALIIVPPLDIQKRIANKIYAIKEQARAFRQCATSLHECAKKDFEEDVLAKKIYRRLK